MEMAGPGTGMAGPGWAGWAVVVAVVVWASVGDNMRWAGGGQGVDAAGFFPVCVRSHRSQRSLLHVDQAHFIGFHGQYISVGWLGGGVGVVVAEIVVFPW